MIGTPWPLTIDVLPGSIAFVALSGPTTISTFTPHGLLFLDLSSLYTSILTNPTGLHVFPIPMDATLIGASFRAQGARSVPGFGIHLTYGLDLFLGAY